MNRQIFARDPSDSQLGRSRDGWEWVWMVGLFLAALLLFGLNLGGVPLSGGEKAAIARWASAVWQGMEGEGQWLLWLTGGEAPVGGYSPLIHGGVAVLYEGFGVNAWTTRSLGAMLAVFSVPLLYSLAREVFPSRAPAGFAALIYLLFWPVVRQGRLAMLDGPLLCFALLTLLCVLRCRRDLRWGWGVGLGLSLLGLTGGLNVWAVAAIALLFWLWDTPRLLCSLYVGWGLLLGALPAIAWLTVLGWQAQGQFGQLLQQVPTELPSTTSAPHVLGAIAASLPWLPFCLWGLFSARNNCLWSWAKLVWVWSGIYLVVVLPLSFYVAISPMPLYPALALAGGAALAEVRNFPSYRPYPRTWSFALMGMSLSVTGLCLFWGWVRAVELGLILLFASVALTLGVVAVLLERQDRQFVIMLFWGLYLSLLLSVSSPYWLWDLGAL